MSLPRSYYDAKRLVSKLLLEAKKIDCCVSDCIFLYDNDSGKKMQHCLNVNFVTNQDITHFIRDQGAKNQL